MTSSTWVKIPCHSMASECICLSGEFYHNFLWNLKWILKMMAMMTKIGFNVLLNLCVVGIWHSETFRDTNVFLKIQWEAQRGQFIFMVRTFENFFLHSLTTQSFSYLSSCSDNAGKGMYGMNGNICLKSLCFLHAYFHLQPSLWLPALNFQPSVPSCSVSSIFLYKF